MTQTPLTDLHALLIAPSSRLWSQVEAALIEWAATTLIDPAASPDAVAVAVALLDAPTRARAYALVLATSDLARDATDADVRAAVLAAVPAMGLALARVRAASATTAPAAQTQTRI